MLWIYGKYSGWTKYWEHLYAATQPSKKKKKAYYKRTVWRKQM